LKAVRIGIPTPEYWDSEFIDQGLAIVMRAAFAKLKGAGAQLVEVDIKAVLEIANARLNQALRRPSGRDLAGWLAQNLPGVTVEQVYAGRPMPNGLQIEPMSDEERTQILTAALQDYTAFFQSSGILAVAMPTLPVPAPPLDEAGAMLESFPVNGKTQHNRKIIPNNLNLSPRIGAPGLSIPAGLTDGLPVGLLLEGLPGDDGRLLGLGIAVENVLGHIPGPTFKGHKA